MVDLKRTAKTVFVYFVGNVLSKLVVLLLFPIYTVYIDTVQYGNYDLACSIINLVAPIAFVQIWDALFRFSFDTDKENDKYALINNSFVVCIFGIIVYMLLLLGVAQFIKMDYLGYVFVYGLVFAFQYVYAYSSRVFLNNSLYVFSGVLNTVVAATLNIVLIAICGWDIKALYISSIVGGILQIIAIDWKINVLKHFKISDIDFGVIKRMILFSTPLCIATVSYWLLSGYSRIVILYQIGEHESGLYAIANRLATIVTVVVSIFQYAWNEAAYLMANDDGRGEIYKSFVNMLFKFMCWVTALLIIFIKIIFPYYIGPQYQEALAIIPATIIGTSANGVATFLSTLFLTEKKTSFIMTSTLIASLFNIVLAIVGAKVFGLQGVAVALMISFIVLLILRVWSMMKQENVKLSKNFIGSLLGLVGSVVLFYLISNEFVLLIVFMVLGIIFLFDIRDIIKIVIRKWKTDN